ncbi:restriction endonuclease subunit S [Streptomyces coeruleorubidus]|uniref:Restriction endonuclease subunit S n=1 Tax=Streptomyces coeruleorubidus TaxID=116188 RepID=A0ABZ0KCD9_STRC4|nr:restriction endonuclease subunit S [Streptomyces coeruleorubidus]WOT35393.1 restriction endonuclease subunit S [Streptomyces coeruleorubidus]
MSWPTAPLKRLVDPTRPITYGIVQAGPDTPGGIPYIRPVDMTQYDGVPDVKRLQRTTHEIAQSYRRSTVAAGDIVVSIGPSYGKTMVVPHILAGANLTQGTARVAPAKNVSRRYLYWALQSALAKQFWDSSVGGATFRALNLEPLGRTPIPLAPLAEQHRIADFLDAETARIDALVLHRYKQSELLGERFESLAKSVTGRTAFRSGTLPDGWSTQQLRRTIKSIKTGTTPSSDDSEIWVEHTQTDTVPWYGPSSIGALLGLTPSLKRLPRSAMAERVVPKFPSGSVLVIGIGATAGKVAYLDHEGTGNQQITALAPELDMVGRFLAWQLWAATDELRELAPYTTLPIINNDFLKSFPIAVPPAAHQRVVVERLDLAASRLRALERTAQQATNLLAERRQALITAAVTGQFDVSTASGRNVTDGVTA